jgi:hypothetical protein
MYLPELSRLPPPNQVRKTNLYNSWNQNWCFAY